MRVFIVNKWAGNVLEFQGVFSEEQKAVEACKDWTYCVCPAIMDEPVHEKSTLWPGAYYPIKGEEGA